MADGADPPTLHRPRRRPDVTSADLAGEVVVFDPVGRRAHVLNPSAAGIWRAIDGRRSEHDVASLLAEQFETPVARVEPDVVVGLAGLGELGLLEGSPVPEPPPPGVTAPITDPTGLPDPASLDLPHAAHPIAVAGVTVRYRSDDPDLVAYLDVVLGSLAADPAPDPEAEVEVCVGRIPAGVAIWVDGVAVARPGSARGVAAFLLWDLNRLAITLGPPRLALHAGAVVAGEGTSRRVVAMPAAPDSGKSTLTLGLVRSGLRYLGDEALAFRLDDRSVVAHRKPLSLDPGSWPLFPDLEPVLPPPLDGFAHAKWHLDLRGVGGGLADPAGLTVDHVTDVVLPRYEAGAATDVTPVAPAELALALAENAFDLHASGAPGLAVLADLAVGARGWRLVSGDLDAAVGAVRDLVG